MNHPVLHWSLSPTMLAPLAVYGGIYLWRFRQARADAGGRGAGPQQLAAFSAAILVLLVAVVSPVDGLGEDYLFSMHMLQHILLGDIAPLLTLLALSRVIMRPATRRLAAVERAFGRFAHPVTALAVYFGLIYVWHVPAMYQAALTNSFVHALEHASFFTAGIAVWWPLIQPVPMRRPLRGIAIFAYMLAAKAGLAAIGLYFVWSDDVLYPYYEAVPRIWGLTPIEDQNGGGALMMFEQSLVLVLVFVALFVRMLAQSERDERRRERLEDAAAA